MLSRNQLVLLVAALTLASLGLFLSSCVEIKVRSAAVVNGPTDAGELTLRLELDLQIDETMLPDEGPDAAPAEPVENQIAYVAVAVPDSVTIQGGRMFGGPELIGDAGSRSMGLAPQLALAMDQEFPELEGMHWVAWHVFINRFAMNPGQTAAVELDLSGIATGTTELLVVPGYLGDTTSGPTPGRPTRLELAVGNGKAIVRVPPATPAAGEVSA